MNRPQSFALAPDVAILPQRIETDAEFVGAAQLPEFPLGAFGIEFLKTCADSFGNPFSGERLGALQKIVRDFNRDFAHFIHSWKLPYCRLVRNMVQMLVFDHPVRLEEN
jgi:hypothetical protein